MLKSTLAVSVATLISRILGLVRDAAIAAYFPVRATDAFFVAFRIPNMFRAVLAEGASQSAIIPVLKELQQNHRDAVGRFLGALFNIALPILAVFSAAGILFSSTLVDAIAFGFRADREKYELAVHLTRIVFPFVLIISVVSLFMSVLNTYNRFFSAALTPAVLNLGMIVGAVMLSRWTARPIDGLAWGVLLGGVGQLIVVGVETLKIRAPFRMNWDPSNEGVRRVGRLMAAAVMGSTVYQLQVLVNTQLASTLPSGSVSALYYADRLIQFPLALVAISMATVSLPILADFAARHDFDAFHAHLHRAFLNCVFLIVPAGVGLFVLREEIVEAVFRRREFGPDQVRETASVLAAYCCGLWAFALTRIAAQAFYAVQKPRVPVLSGAVALVVTAGVGWWAMGRWGVTGVAMGTVAGAVVQLSILTLMWKSGGASVPAGGNFWTETAKALIASGAMALVLVLVRGALPVLRGSGYGGGDAGAGVGPIARLAVLMVCGMGSFLAVAYVIRSGPIREFAARIFSRDRV